MFVRNNDSDENKLSFKTLGPFRVISNEGATITVDYDGVHQRLSSDRLLPVPKPDVPLKPNQATRELSVPTTDGPESGVVPPEPSSSPNDDADDSNVGYVIDQIIGHRITAQAKELLVKWFGYAEPTWELKDNIPPALHSRYLQKKFLQKKREPSQEPKPRASPRRSSPRVQSQPLRRSARLTQRVG